MFKITENTNGNLTVLRLSGAMDLKGATALKEKIQEVRKAGAMNVILNFADVSSITSSVLQHLLTPIRALTLVRGVIALCDMSNSIQKILQTAMFYPMVNTYKCEEDAIGDLAEKTQKTESESGK
jgi:stage II sporulation protein AA (anti-sigma F factor antagonist)